MGKSAFSFLDEHDQHRTALELMREMENEHNRSETFTVRFRHADGSWRDVEVAGVNRFTSLGGLVVGMRDVSTRRVSDRVLAASERLYRSLPTLATDLTIITDGADARIYVSASVTQLLGYAPNELIELPEEALVHVEDRELLAAARRRVAQTPGASETFDIRLQPARGPVVWFETNLVNLLDDPAVRGVVLYARNIDERRRLEAQLRYRAKHDPLTGLHNRFSFIELLDALPKRASSNPDREGLALLFCDLDGFKQVNDGHGHQTGDEVLARVAHRLRSAVRPGDPVARIGGDEFCVICTGLSDPKDAVEIAERIRNAMEEPFAIEGGSTSVGVSIGIAWTQLREPCDGLLAHADRAMYTAKSGGRRGIHVVALG